MVLINLSKLIRFSAIVSSTPLEVSKRTPRLKESYLSLTCENAVNVSLKLNGRLERLLKESHLDQEDEKRKHEMLEEIILILTQNPLHYPLEKDGKVFLVLSVIQCLSIRE